tara:strand:+ start:1041 stop:1457 length:417 start_codon:yes stop_codon:yes gene_type:complete
MLSIEEVYNQALEDTNAIQELKPLGFSVINYGVKIQKFLSKTEILNCSRSGDYFQECNEEEYQLFFIHGWRKGGIRLSMMNCKRKLDLIEERIKREVNTRKNDKHIQRLKTSRENLLIKYSKRKKQLKQITNGKEEHL